MAERNKSGTADVAKPQVDPARTNGFEQPASERGNVLVQRGPGRRVYVAVLLQEALRESSHTSLRRDSSTWNEKSLEDRKDILNRLDGSYGNWARRELNAFRGIKDETEPKSKLGANSNFETQLTLAIKAAREQRKALARRELEDSKLTSGRTAEEVQAAKERLRVEAFGAQILMARKGEPVVGWLKRSPEERKAAMENFERAYKAWASEDQRQYADRAGKKREGGSTGRLPNSADAPSKPARDADKQSAAARELTVRAVQDYQRRQGAGKPQSHDQAGNRSGASTGRGHNGSGFER